MIKRTGVLRKESQEGAVNQNGEKWSRQRQRLDLQNCWDLSRTNYMGLLYTCEGIVRKPLGSVYACVCRVLAVRVMESVLHVGDEVGVRLECL